MKATTDRIVLAFGGNALLRKGDRGTAEEQYARSLAAMEAIPPLLTPEQQVVLTHGNGPIVGHILIRHQVGRLTVPAMPLDVCGAESQGNIGYALERALLETLQQHRLHKSVATLLSLVEVDRHDPAFLHPSKPIGPFLSESEANALARTTSVVHDADRGFRRVVASPQPRRIVESAAIEALLTAGVIVITLGGGGVPVAYDENGHLVGVEAVIDKDLSSSLLATQISASTLIILTDIDRVYLNFLDAKREAVSQMTAHEAALHLERGEFLPGSMAPKIEAAIAFLHHGGRQVFIGLPEALPYVLTGNAGTRIVP